MTIKYELKFENTGLTLTQTIDQDGTVEIPKGGVPVVQNEIPKAVVSGAGSGKGGIGGSGSDPDIPGTGRFGTSGGPLTIIGPFIFMCPCMKPKLEDNHE